jgi:hypothetical protein
MFYQYKDMDNCKLIRVDKTFNKDMLSILAASPINASGLHIYFDKSPDIFEIPRMKYSAGEHFGFFMDDSLKGFGSLGYFNALVKGQIEKVFTFYNFYLLPEARGKKIPYLAMKEFFSGVTGNANYGISITMKGNRSTESYIGRRIDHWMPPTRVIDELVVKSILFALPKKNETNYTIRNARPEDIPAIVKLLKEEHRQRDFGLIFEEDTFQLSLEKRGLQIENYFVAIDKRGTFKGVCLAWDCSSFRRTKVLRFSSKFYPSLLAYKTLEKIFPLAPFPKKGENFNELTITDYAVMNRDPVIMHALLSEIYRRHHNRKYHFMNWASCGSDDLLKAAKGFWHKNICSHIIFTSMDPERYNIKTHLPYIDIAFI